MWRFSDQPFSVFLKIQDMQGILPIILRIQLRHGRIWSRKFIRFYQVLFNKFYQARCWKKVLIKYSVLSYKVDLLKVTTINGIATEGSNGRYIKKFSLTYTTESSWIKADVKQFYNNEGKVGIFCFLSEHALTLCNRNLIWDLLYFSSVSKTVQ